MSTLTQLQLDRDQDDSERKSDPFFERWPMSTLTFIVRPSYCDER